MGGSVSALDECIEELRACELYNSSYTHSRCADKVEAELAALRAENEELRRLAWSGWVQALKWRTRSANQKRELQNRHRVEKMIETQFSAYEHARFEAFYDALGLSKKHLRFTSYQFIVEAVRKAVTEREALRELAWNWCLKAVGWRDLHVARELHHSRLNAERGGP